MCSACSARRWRASRSGAVLHAGGARPRDRWSWRSPRSRWLLGLLPFASFGLLQIGRLDPGDRTMSAGSPSMIAQTHARRHAGRAGRHAAGLRLAAPARPHAGPAGAWRRCRRSRRRCWPPTARRWCSTRRGCRSRSRSSRRRACCSASRPCSGAPRGSTLEPIWAGAGGGRFAVWWLLTPHRQPRRLHRRRPRELLSDLRAGQPRRLGPRRARRHAAGRGGRARSMSGWRCSARSAC